MKVPYKHVQHSALSNRKKRKTMCPTIETALDKIHYIYIINCRYGVNNSKQYHSMIPFLKRNDLSLKK